VRKAADRAQADQTPDVQIVFPGLQGAGRMSANPLPEFLNACLGDTPGVLHIAIGYRGHFNGTDRYEHDEWRGSHYAWPAEADQAVREMLAAAPESDVYVCPYLMHADKRAKGAAVARDHVHADVDAGLLDAEKVRALNGFAVASGTPGNGHAYVALTESVPARWHEALCRGLGAHLGAVDAKISDNDVLRPPGTFNHKSAAKDGAAPTPVKWLVGPSGVRVDPHALAQALGVTLPDQVPTAAKTSAVAVDAELPVEFNIDDHPEVKAALGQVTTDRSVDTMRVVGACRGSGLTRAHARYAVNTRPDLAARLAERHDDDVAECWRKLADAEKAKAADSAGWLSDANISELLVNRVLRGKYCWAKGLGWMRF
jgi:RepB DNA-primase from phage plasmid